MNTQQNYNWIGNLEPRRVFEFFSDINAIPRETGNLEEVSRAVENWIQRMGLRVERDAYCNVKAFKPATPGYENGLTVMLTSHLDMVCAKTPESDHDFRKDPIRILLKDGDTITADGTTLGADDAIGAAMILALLESKSISHPAIEAVFTADEETDMNGALHLDYSDLHSSLILNLDSPAIGIAGAGELDVEMRFGWQKTPVKNGYICRRIVVSGLQGGHSGDEATKERGNAVMLLNRVLMALDKRFDIQLLTIQGGNGMSTAFAYHATATVAFPAESIEQVQDIIAEFQAVYTSELKQRDPGVKLEVNMATSTGWAIDSQSGKKLIALLAALPDGVFSVNLPQHDLMESCVNVGVVETEEKAFSVIATIRSAVKSKKYYLYDRIALLCQIISVDLRVIYDLPQWDMNLSEGLLNLAKELYPECQLLIEQGTNECGVFCDRMPGASVISVLFPINGAHSVNERISAAQCALYYKRLILLLEKLRHTC